METVSVVEAEPPLEGVKVEGLREAEGPLGTATTVRLTDPEKLFKLFTLIPEVPEAPA